MLVHLSPISTKSIIIQSLSIKRIINQNLTLLKFMKRLRLINISKKRKDLNVYPSKLLELNYTA